MRSGDTLVIQLLMFHYNDCNNLIYRTNNNNVIAPLMSELCRTVSSVGFVFVFSVLFNNNNYYYYNNNKNRLLALGIYDNNNNNNNNSPKHVGIE